jgi:hypothetical protein
VSIPCEGSYCRALVALSLGLSPLWFGVYFMTQFSMNLWGIGMIVFTSIMFVFGLLLIRYAPGGEGTLATILAVSTVSFNVTALDGENTSHSLTLAYLYRFQLHFMALLLQQRG